MENVPNCLMVFMCAGMLMVVSGCSDVDLDLLPARATLVYTTAIHNELISLPEPKEKIVVAVYKFRDQTGQYKASGTSTTFSTAVTQGATSMLNKALEDSGWFVPIEREGLSNLLNERKIIRSTRLQHRAETGNKVESLPPMLYAGVLLEGGVIAYDTDFVTGGFGARYFGIGGFGQFRKDRVTVYLRLVSVKNGQILKSVSTTKTVLSQEVDFGVYRFVRVARLLEIETGLSTNEPPSMCVLEAIEKAVYDLVIEGIGNGIWSLKNPQDINSPMIQSYFEEKGRLQKAVALDKKDRLVEKVDINEGDPTVSQLRKIVEEGEAEATRESYSQKAPETTAEAIEKAKPEVMSAEQKKPKSATEFLREVIGKSPRDPSTKARDWYLHAMRAHP